MPHLQFEINKSVSDRDKEDFMANIRKYFAEIMDTGTDHISISIREYGTFNLSIGRIKNLSEGVALINADIREGRSIEQRRKLALAFMDEIKKRWHIPESNIYLTFTEHKGEDFHLYERYLRSWQTGEDPLSG